MKLLGSLCILCGGCGAWLKILRERNGHRQALRELIAALRQIAESLRLTRKPLPQLFHTATESCNAERKSFFQHMELAAKEGEALEMRWRQEVNKLPLAADEREILKELGTCFSRDEQGVCQALLYAVERLETIAREHGRKRAEQDRQTAALCFSGAALLLILLI